MSRGGKRAGSGRKSAGERTPVMVRLDRDLKERINGLRDGQSMSATVEQLLRLSVKSVISDDEDAANAALGFVLAQAATAADSDSRNWRNDAGTRSALKLALPHIIDLFAPPVANNAAKPHPMFKSEEEHARWIYLWIVRRLSEHGDEYGTNWPKGHPLRNFPRAAAALNFKPPAGLKKD